MEAFRASKRQAPCVGFGRQHHERSATGAAEPGGGDTRAEGNGATRAASPSNEPAGYTQDRRREAAPQPWCAANIRRLRHSRGACRGVRGHYAVQGGRAIGCLAEDESADIGTAGSVATNVFTTARSKRCRDKEAELLFTGCTQLGVCCLATHLLLCAHDNRACAQACDAAHAALSAAGAALQAGESAALLAFRGSVVGPDKPFRGGQDEAVWSAHKDALVASLTTYASRTAPPGLEVAGGVTSREWDGSAAACE